MKCPQCQTENPGTRKFCRECGAKLSLLCPKCASENLPGDKFCGECGHDLSLPTGPMSAELTFEEKLGKIQRYLPRGLTEKILSRRDKIEGERKQVTVMFCDMAGFTLLAERLGPEKAYKIMDQVYEILIHKVHDYEGTVNEMTGDGIMALFGAPIALEDAPQSALRSAQAIHREIARFSEKLEQEKIGPAPIKMRIGIHTGTVVVGTLGNDLRVEFKAVGDTVNLASRMEALAAPGTTYVTKETFKLTEGLFRFEALGKRGVKGKSEPVLVYRVLGTGRSRSRFEARAEKGLTGFVGRERELEMLRDCFERAREGRGQALSIVAEAGLGKSRLLYEFRKSLANEEVTFLEGRCASYGQNSPYLPVIDVLRDNFRIENEDGPKEVQEKVKRGLKQIDGSMDEKLPYLSELFSLENGFEALKAMDPEIKRRKTFETIRDLTLRGSQLRPLVIAFEDLHWIDKTSEESIKLLIDHITGARVFLILTFRSNYLPPWGGKSYYSQITLNRLANRESLQMIQSLLNAEEIEDNLARLILEKAEGVPFFVEEVTRSLSESGAVVRDGGRCGLNPDLGPVRVPEMLLDLIMARVDRLPEGAKEVLQVGSVIEREFSWPLLKEVTGIPDAELLSRLSYAKEAELVFERGIFPRTTYIFQHAMTQEVIYNSLLTEKRGQIHGALGKAMEKVYPDRLEEHYPMLGVHFTRGGELERGYHYLLLAGERAAKAFANLEAREHFRQAWQLLDELGQSSDVRSQRLDTALRLAEVMETLGEFEPTLFYLKEALKASEELDDPAGHAKVHFWMGNTLGNLGRYNEAREHLFLSLKLAQDSGDKETEGNAHNYLCQLDYAQGQMKRGMVHADAAIRCLLEVGVPDRIAWAFLFKRAIIGESRPVNEWQDIVKQTMDWVERSQNDRARCLVHALNSRELLQQGEYENASIVAMDGLRLAESIGEGIQAVFLLAHAGLGALYSGDGDTALELLEKGKRIGEEIGHPWGMAYICTALGGALLHLGKIDACSEPAEKALKLCQDVNLGVTRLLALEVNAELMASKIPVDEAQVLKMMEEALNLVESIDSPWSKIDYLMASARIYQKLGRREAARKSLSEAKALYREMGLEHGTEQLRSLEKKLEG